VATRAFVTHVEAQRSRLARRHAPSVDRGHGTGTVIDVEAEFDWLVTGLASPIRQRRSALRTNTRPDHRVEVSPAMIHERALRLIDEEGVRALNMRRVAAEFKICTRTLYKRIGSRGRLIREVLQLHGSVLMLTIPDGASWELRAWEWCVSMREALRAHPHLTVLLQQDRPAMLEGPIRQLVDLAVGEGVSTELAERLSWSLANVTVDDVARELAEVQGIVAPRRRRSRSPRNSPGSSGGAAGGSRGVGSAVTGESPLSFQSSEGLFT
jgi:AcrR family transcriptional regulator